MVIILNYKSKRENVLDYKRLLQYFAKNSYHFGLSFLKTNISKMTKDFSNYSFDRYSLLSVKNHFYFTRKRENIT